MTPFAWLRRWWQAEAKAGARSTEACGLCGEPVPPDAFWALVPDDDAERGMRIEGRRLVVACTREHLADLTRTA